MVNIEWSPLFLDKDNSENLQQCANYAIKFFNNSLLFMVSENENIKDFNKLKAESAFLKKEIMDNHHGIRYSFTYNNRTLLFTSCQDEGGIFWRKL